MLFLHEDDSHKSALDACLLDGIQQMRWLAILRIPSCFTKYTFNFEERRGQAGCCFYFRQDLF